MFDVLIYLFETYMHNESEMLVDQDKITDDLADAGFYREDINNALNWLEVLADLQEGQKAPYLYTADPQALRIYTVEECRRLGPPAVVLSSSLNKFRYYSLILVRW